MRRYRLVYNIVKLFRPETDQGDINGVIIMQGNMG